MKNYLAVLAVLMATSATAQNQDSTNLGGITTPFYVLDAYVVNATPPPPPPTPGRWAYVRTVSGVGVGAMCPVPFVRACGSVGATCWSASDLTTAKDYYQCVP
jgi:hypothetical protein